MSETTGPRQVRISGRLLEIDHHDGTAEVWDPRGRMHRIHFREDQRTLVDGAWQQQVVVQGLAEVDPSGRLGPVTVEWLTAVQAGHTPAGDERATAGPLTPSWKQDDEEEFLDALSQWQEETAE